MSSSLVDQLNAQKVQIASLAGRIAASMPRTAAEVVENYERNLEAKNKRDYDKRLTDEQTRITFREVDLSNLWIWIELRAAPSGDDAQLL